MVIVGVMFTMNTPDNVVGKTNSIIILRRGFKMRLNISISFPSNTREMNYDQSDTAYFLKKIKKM